MWLKSQCNACNWPKHMGVYYKKKREKINNSLQFRLHCWPVGPFGGPKNENHRGPRHNGESMQAGHGAPDRARRLAGDGGEQAEMKDYAGNDG